MQPLQIKNRLVLISDEENDVKLIRSLHASILILPIREREAHSGQRTTKKYK
jgi:hypothetical protein